MFDGNSLVSHAQDILVRAHVHGEDSSVDLQTIEVYRSSRVLSLDGHKQCENEILGEAQQGESPPTHVPAYVFQLQHPALLAIVWMPYVFCSWEACCV